MIPQGRKENSVKVDTKFRGSGNCIYTDFPFSVDAVKKGGNKIPQRWKKNSTKVETKFRKGGNAQLTVSPFSL